MVVGFILSGDEKKDWGQELPIPSEAYMPEYDVHGHGRESRQRGTRKRKGQGDSSLSLIHI